MRETQHTAYAQRQSANSGCLGRLVRESWDSLSFRPPVTCACGANLRVIDHAPRKDGLRYEVTCDACLSCDPNGYGSQREVVLRYFPNTERHTRRESEVTDGKE